LSRLKDDFPKLKIIKLEQNYRSSKTIVGAANSLISKNKDQLHKEVWTDNTQGERIVIHKTVSDNDEGNYIARLIFEKQMNDHLPYESFAILYRTNAQSRAMEDALRRKNIPYRIYGGLSFYQRKEVKDVLAYFRLTINPKDEEAFRRVINYPKRGIGDTTIDKLTVAANQNNVTIWEACQNPLLLEQAGINRPTQTKLQDFVTKVQSYQVLAAKEDAFEVAGHIAKTSGLIREFSEDKTPEGVSRYENIQELLNSVKEFTDNQREIENGNPALGSFMEDVALITDSDKGSPDDKNKVSLMTVHLAKGLEFPVVFIVGMEESLFPSMMSMGSRADLEEERRLFYVALTRAEKEAYLTYAQMRYRWGKLIDCEPSRFLEEIDDKYLNIMTPDFSPFSGSEIQSQPRSRPQPTRRRPQVSQRPSAPPPKNLKRVAPSHNDEGNYEALTDVNVGERVKHQRFGMGTVSDLEGSGPNKKALIEFDNVGEKKLLLKFAKLERLKA
ncbi:MAG: ATP-dependent helicase, partial [Owenweeksia sp.]